MATRQFLILIIHASVLGQSYWPCVGFLLMLWEPRNSPTLNQNREIREAEMHAHTEWGAYEFVQSAAAVSLNAIGGVMMEQKIKVTK